MVSSYCQPQQCCMWGVPHAHDEQTDKRTRASATAEPAAAKLYSCGPETEDLRNTHRHCLQFTVNISDEGVL